MMSQEPQGTWNPFVEARTVAEILASGQASEDMPKAVSAGLRFLSAYEISDYWKDLIETDGKIPDIQYLISTYNLLIDGGFKETTVAYCLLAMLAACIGYNRVAIDLLNPQRGKLCDSVAKAMLSGYVGPPDRDTIKWILDFAEDNNDKGTKTLTDLLNESAAGSDDAQRQLVSVIVPFWKELVPMWRADNWNHHTDSLGFPFKYAEATIDHPDFMVWKARVFYQFGASGDETRAYELVARAAFLGSPEAWELIDDWSSIDMGRVMTSIIDVGRAMFCDASADE